MMRRSFWVGGPIRRRPDDPLSEDENSWLDVALWRRAGRNTMRLEWADGFFTALAVGPERLSPERYLPAIVGTSEAGPVFDSPQHDAYVAELLARWFATIERSLADDEAVEPFINRDVDELEGTLGRRAIWPPSRCARTPGCR